MSTALWMTILGLMAVPILVLLNAFFVAAEFALVGVRRTRLEEMVRAGRAGARAAQEASSKLDQAIAATQLGITLASLGLGWVGEPVLARLIEPVFDFLPDNWQVVAAHSAAVTLAFSIITFLHVVIGELAPKALALQMPDSVSLVVARPLLIFARVSRPALWLLNGSGNLVVRLLGMQPRRLEQMVHSVEELGLLIEQTKEAGVLSADQAQFVQNVFEFSSKTVAEAMVPLGQMASIELHTPPEQVLEAVRECAHTRMPVYEGSPDNIVGIVNTKDLFHLFSLHGLVVIDDAMYSAPFVRPADLVATVLRRLKRLKRHMAIVRDDAGTVRGLITLEDVLEEIVGEIEDEHDQLPAQSAN